MENTNINDKSKIIKLMISVIILIVIALVGTYALTIWRSQENTELTLRIGDISGFYCTKGDNIEISNIGPIFDYTIDGESTTFSVDNQTNEVAKVSVKFNVTTITDNLKEESFKYVLMTNTDNSSYTVYKEGNFKDVTSNSSITLLDNYEVVLSSKVLFKLVIYIDGNMESPITMQGGSLIGYLDACKEEDTNKKLDSSGANRPVLVDGLIPVVYDELTSTWVKADTTSSTSTYGWYDYDNKKWANAVLVREKGYTISSTVSPIVKDVNIMDPTRFTSSNAYMESSTAESTFTIITANNAGTLSFNYNILTEEGDHSKLYITIENEKTGTTTTVANGITSTSDEETYSTSVTENTTYNINVQYEKDDYTDYNYDTDDVANIYNFSSPAGSSFTIIDGDEYTFTAMTSNNIGAKYSYDTVTSKYKIEDTTADYFSGNINGKYICEDVETTECSKMYKILQVGTNITRVEEYTASNIQLYNAREKYKSSNAGTTIVDKDILAFYVWIPRYKYKVWNKDKVIGTQSYNAQTEGIDIVFEEGASSTGTISCTYSYAAPSSTAGSPNETCTGSNGDYYTHPAFTFGTQGLTGFWVGKFELSSETPSADSGGGNSTTLTPRILPNVKTWRNNKVSNFWKVIYDMQKESNIYGLSTSRTNADSHMLTNMEWGAVAYLTNSNYGRCTNGSCIEVTINNCNLGITGIGADTVSAGTFGTTCTTSINKYNGEKGILASTTGNITGVYDMAGGLDEYVMGNMSSSNGTVYIYNVGNVGSNFTYSADTAKYLTPYAYGTTYKDQAAYNRGRLGDATGEVVLSSGGYGSWYKDKSMVPFNTFSWFCRGDGYSSGSGGGLFSYSQINAASSGSTRAVITTS